MGTLGGLALIVLITLLAGAIAYVGDRVGHQIGRKRLTLFNLRPKYTSTIVAVGTGMMIALVATVLALSFSAYARAAFFHLDEINTRVNQLQATADALNRHVRESNVVLNRGDLVYDQFLVIAPSMTHDQKMKSLSAFFDAIVQTLDRRYVPAGLKPTRLKSTDPEVAKTLDSLLADQRVAGFLLNGQIIILAMADQNLFVNDPIHFGLQPYPDQRLFAAGQPLASVQVDGGTLINPTIAYTQLSGAAEAAAITVGMPGPFARALPALQEAEVRQTVESIHAGTGRYYIVARPVIDIYPHTGGIPIRFTLDRSPK